MRGSRSTASRPTIEPVAEDAAVQVLEVLAGGVEQLATHQAVAEPRRHQAEEQHVALRVLEDVGREIALGHPEGGLRRHEGAAEDHRRVRLVGKGRRLPGAGELCAPLAEGLGGVAAPQG